MLITGHKQLKLILSQDPMRRFLSVTSYSHTHKLPASQLNTNSLVFQKRTFFFFFKTQRFLLSAAVASFYQQQEETHNNSWGLLMRVHH